MPLIHHAHHAATWALVGLIWTIQLVHYPLFQFVSREAFPTYHRQHVQRITWLAGPLMAVEGLTAALLLWSGTREPWFLLSLLPLAMNWLSTVVWQVPLHAQLATGYQAPLLAALVRTNWCRTIGWSLRGACLLLGLKPLCGVPHHVVG